MLLLLLNDRKIGKRRGVKPKNGTVPQRRPVEYTKLSPCATKPMQIKSAVHSRILLHFLTQYFRHERSKYAYFHDTQYLWSNSGEGQKD